MKKYLNRKIIMTILISFFCFLITVGATLLATTFEAGMITFGFSGIISTFVIIFIYDSLL